MARLDPTNAAEYARARRVTVERGDVIWHPDVRSWGGRTARFPPTRSTLDEHAAAISDPSLGNTVRAAHELLQQTRRALERGEPLPEYVRDLRGLRALDAGDAEPVDLPHEQLLGHLRIYRERLAEAALNAAGLRTTPGRLRALTSWIANDTTAILTPPPSEVDVREPPTHVTTTATAAGSEPDDPARTLPT